jgi:glycosyltransferase involved in cell wall biosynthesis
MTRPEAPDPRILYLIDSLSVGGAEKSLVALAREYRSLGVDLHVAHLRPRAHLAGQLESIGVVVHRVAGPERRVSWIREARRLIRRIEPDVVHTTLFEADIVGRTAAVLTDIPVVSSFVTDSYGPEHLSNPEYRTLKVRAAHLADLVSARRVDYFHAVSQNAASLMSQRLRINRDRIDIIPRGRDPRLLGEGSAERRIATRRRIGIHSDVPLILAVARHHHIKGLDTLVAAFAAVRRAYPEGVLFVAGREGPATDTLRSQLLDLGIESSVILAGQRDDVPDLLTAADVFVIPSRVEGSPGALIEAMALNVPTVASDIPSIREVVGSPPVALLFELDDDKSLADGIVQLLDDKDLGSELATAAHRRFVAQFTMERVARQMMGVYSKALTRRGAGESPARARFEEARDGAGKMVQNRRPPDSASRSPD